MATVVFDFDGVLIRRDSTVELLRRRLAVRPALGPLLLPSITAFAAAGGREELRTRAARRIFSVAFAGMPRGEAARWVRATGAALGRNPALVVADAISAMHVHQEAGDTLVVASAGLEPFIEGFLCAAGVNDAVVLGSTLRDGPRGAALDRHNFGRAKMALANDAGHPPPWARVYSDSLADLPLLRHAEVPVLVNGSPRKAAHMRAALSHGPLSVSWT